MMDNPAMEKETRGGREWGGETRSWGKTARNELEDTNSKVQRKKEKIGRRLCFVLVSDGDGGDEDNDDDKVIYDGNFGY